jgi:hypothetical protein
MAVTGTIQHAFFKSDFEGYRDAHQRLHDMMYIGVPISQPFTLDNIAQAMKSTGPRWGLYGHTAEEHLKVIGEAMKDIQAKRAAAIT